MGDFTLKPGFLAFPEKITEPVARAGFPGGHSPQSSEQLPTRQAGVSHRATAHAAMHPGQRDGRVPLPEETRADPGLTQARSLALGMWRHIKRIRSSVWGINSHVWCV